MIVERKFGRASIRVEGNWEQCQAALADWVSQAKSESAFVELSDFIRAVAIGRRVPGAVTGKILDVLKHLLKENNA